MQIQHVDDSSYCYEASTKPCERTGTVTHTGLSLGTSIDTITSFAYVLATCTSPFTPRRVTQTAPVLNNGSAQKSHCRGGKDSFEEV